MKEYIRLNESQMFISKENFISKAATTLFVTAAQNTEYGTWEVSDVELAELLDVDCELIDSLSAEIASEMHRLYGQVVAEIDVNECEDGDGNLSFDITLYGIGIPQYAIEDACLTDYPCEEE